MFKNTNKLFPLLIMSCLIIIFSSSCIAGHDIDISQTGAMSGSESSAEDEPSQDIDYKNRKDICYEKLFDIYEGKTSEELISMYEKNGVNFTGYGSARMFITNTLTKVFFRNNNDGKGNLYAYNKLTGNVTYACPDPLCDHIGCIFGEESHVLFGGTKLFVISKHGSTEGSGIKIYVTDENGSNPKKIYETEDDIKKYACINDTLFFISPYMKENEDIAYYRVVSIDPEGNFKAVTPENISVDKYVINDAGIFYSDFSYGCIYFTVEGIKADVIYDGAAEFLVGDDYILGDGYIYFNVYNENYTVSHLYRIPQKGGEKEILSENVSNELFYSNGYIYYYHYSERDFFELHRFDVEAKTDEKMFTAETEGYADTLVLYLIDGPFCYAYTTNIYDELEAAGGFGRNLKNHFTVFDMRDGSKYLIDPSE